MDKPPAMPWVRGETPEYRSFDLVVHVCQDRDGKVWSGHDFREESDAETAKAMPLAGVRQTAYALLVEAARREAYVDALVRLSEDREFLDKYLKAPPETQAMMEEALGKAAVAVMTRTLPKFAPGIGKEILWMLSGRTREARGESNPPQPE